MSSISQLYPLVQSAIISLPQSYQCYLSYTFPMISSISFPSFLDYLDTTLTFYHPSKFRELLVLCNFLSRPYTPGIISSLKRDLSTAEETLNTPLPDTMTPAEIEKSRKETIEWRNKVISLLKPVDYLNVVPPFPISIDDYVKAKGFWDILGKHRRKLNKIIRAHLDTLSFSDFLLSYPLIDDLDLKQNILNKYYSNIVTRIITIDRNSILETSFAALNQIPNSTLPCRLRIQYLNSLGVDEGGLLTDWFYTLGTCLFSFQDLFEPTPSGQAIMIKKFTRPDQNDANQEELKKEMNRRMNLYFFAGEILGLAIINQKLVNAHLSSGLYKKLLNRKTSLSDLDSIDKMIANSLRSLAQETISEEDAIGLTFAIGDTDLIENGSNIEVTEENKHQYITLAIEYYLEKDVQAEIQAFTHGFWKIVPPFQLGMFAADELELMLCGIPEISIDDLQQNTEYDPPYHSNHPTIKRLFRVLREWKIEDIGRLLKFVTGTPQVPAGGFKTLQMRGIPFRISPGGDKNMLPQGHTCYNQLDLPNYESDDEMSKKILLAIRNTDSFELI